MIYLIGFGLVFVGFFLGVLIAALCCAAGKRGKKGEKISPELSAALIHATAQAIIRALQHEYIPTKKGISMSMVIEGVIEKLFETLGIPVCPPDLDGKWKCARDAYQGKAEHEI